MRHASHRTGCASALAVYTKRIGIQLHLSRYTSLDLLTLSYSYFWLIMLSHEMVAACRYNLYGDICSRAAIELRKPDVRIHDLHQPLS